MGWVLDDLLSTSEYTYERTLGRVEGLTDEEMGWEPVPWCWSIRAVDRGSEGRYDGSGFPPSVPAFTTIAWRLTHVADNYGEDRNAPWLGLSAASLDLPTMPPITTSATDAIARLRVGFDRWRTVLRACDESELGTPLGPIAGQWATSTRFAFILHELDEVIHHGAEIGVLRDLYRAQGVEPPAMTTVADAAANGRWDLVVEMASNGADVTGGAFSALHLAVSTGNIDIVRLLVAKGADLSATDAEYSMTPLQWAEWFENDEAISLLSR